MFQRIKNKTYQLLRWSEKYTKTDMVYLAHGGFWLTLNQAISSISGFILSIAFANLLPKEIYGNYKYILSVAGLLSVFTLPGINTSITRAVAQGLEGSIFPALKTKIRWGLLGSLVSLILAAYYYVNSNHDFTIAFLIMAVFLPFMESFYIYDGILAGKKKFKYVSQYGIISQLFALIVTVVIIFLTQEIFLIVLAYFASWALMRYVSFRLTIRRFELNCLEDIEVIRYGKHLSLMGALSMISSQIDKIIIFHFLGAIQLAVYSMAIVMPQQIKMINKIASTIMLPKLSARSIPEIKSVMPRRVLLFFLVSILITAAYILATPLLFNTLFPAYTEAVKYSQIFSITIIFLPRILFHQTLLAHKFQKELYTLQTIIPLVRISLLATLTPFFGIIGVLFAIFIAEILNLVMTIIFYRKI